MRSYPKTDDKYEQKELLKLNAEPWQIDLLKLNPEYVYWGPYEDYMTDKSGWRKPCFFNSWDEMWQLDELNECVNFYFEVERENVPCKACDQEGYNPETLKISNDFYDFDNTGSRWCDKITQDELDVLIEKGRIRTTNIKRGVYKDENGVLRYYGQEKEICTEVPIYPTLEEVNAANRSGGRKYDFMMNHDALNRSYLIETRAKRLGVYGHCSECNGEGFIYTEDKAHVNLILWMILPRKGACRGVEIKNIKQEELPKIFEWLNEAKYRNEDRFSKIPT